MGKRKLQIKKEELLHLVNTGLSDNDIAIIYNTTSVKIKYKRYYYNIVRINVEKTKYLEYMEFLCTVKPKFNITYV